MLSFFFLEAHLASAVGLLDVCRDLLYMQRAGALVLKVLFVFLVLHSANCSLQAVTFHPSSGMKGTFWIHNFSIPYYITPVVTSCFQLFM